MGMFPDSTLALARSVLDAARARGLRIVTAESCTGGLIAACLTDIPGSSDVVERGFVTYSNEAKMELLGVDSAFIQEHGAVSTHVARAMAKGALRLSHAHIAVSSTGIAGPGGGTTDKPVGLVYIGTAFDLRKATAPGAESANPVGGNTMECRFGDIGRERVRLAAVEMALKLLHGPL